MKTKEIWCTSGIQQLLYNVMCYLTGQIQEESSVIQGKDTMVHMSLLITRKPSSVLENVIMSVLDQESETLIYSSLCKNNLHT